MDETQPSGPLSSSKPYHQPSGLRLMGTKPSSMAPIMTSASAGGAMTGLSGWLPPPVPLGWVRPRIPVQPAAPHSHLATASPNHSNCASMHAISQPIR